MKIIGVDYGLRKIGIAVGDTETKFAEPVTVIRFESLEQGLQKVHHVVQVEQAEKVVIGISEGKIADETREFGANLQRNLEIPVKYFDETLSTYDAKELSISAGIKRKKRKMMEDAYAASIMLQNYLEKH